MSQKQKKDSALDWEYSSIEKIKYLENQNEKAKKHNDSRLDS